MSDALSVKVLDPLSYHRQFIENGVRVDNRDLIESRQIQSRINCLSDSDCVGSSLIIIGEDNNTNVMCSVKALVGRSAIIFKSNSESSIESTSTAAGYIFLRVTLSPACSPLALSTNLAHVKTIQNAASIQQVAALQEGDLLRSQLAQVLGIDPIQQQATCLNSSCVIDRAALTIGQGVAWHLFIDVYCLTSNGSLLDAALLSILCALRSAAFPNLVIASTEKSEDANSSSSAQPAVVVTDRFFEDLHPDAELADALFVWRRNDPSETQSSAQFAQPIEQLVPPGFELRLSDEAKSMPLALRSLPISTSFALFDGQYILVDPSADEELMCSAVSDCWSSPSPQTAANATTTTPTARAPHIGSGSLVFGVPSTLTIAVDDSDGVVLVHRPGGAPLADKQLLTCAQFAVHRAANIRGVLRSIAPPALDHIGPPIGKITLQLLPPRANVPKQKQAI